MASEETLDEKKESGSTRLPRDLRYRQQLFPGSDELVFKVSDKGFVPVPIILRKLFRYLSSPETRVLLYLCLRASRYSICYPSTDEMVHELGLTSKKNLIPHLESLEHKRFISTRTSGSKTYYLIYDPRVAIKHLLQTGQMRREELFEINDLYADLNQSLVTDPRPEQSEETAL